MGEYNSPTTNRPIKGVDHPSGIPPPGSDKYTFQNLIDKDKGILESLTNPALPLPVFFLVVYRQSITQPCSIDFQYVVFSYVRIILKYHAVGFLPLTGGEIGNPFQPNIVWAGFDFQVDPEVDLSDAGIPTDVMVGALRLPKNALGCCDFTRSQFKNMGQDLE